MAKRIGIITLYRGYNYGTSLQAYALKQFVASLGYDTDIIWTAEGAKRGRDIRIGKIARIFWRCLWHPSLLKHTFLSYKNSLLKDINPKIKAKFLAFAKEYLAVKALTREKLKSFAYSEDTLAIICGSDQIWSANSANIEPLYFLRFAPQNKRISYAPSFGAIKVPSYNKKILAQYIKEIPFISVREAAGAEIVKELTGKQAAVLADPTLLLDWEDIKPYQSKKPYILAYFLDTPSKYALQTLGDISKKYNYDIKVFPYRYKEYEQFPGLQFYPAGPLDFVSLIKGAECVLTDSFHGTVFSINFNIPFWVFERNYASAKNQNTRIISILEKTGLQNHYITKTTPNNLPTGIDAKAWIIEQRKKAKEYLVQSIEKARGINE